jgi:hypothetical protein
MAGPDISVVSGRMGRDGFGIRADWSTTVLHRGSEMN